MPKETSLNQMQESFHWVKEVIRAEEMWERVPEHSREFSPENLENLVKYPTSAALSTAAR